MDLGGMLADNAAGQLKTDESSIPFRLGGLGKREDGFLSQRYTGL